MSTIEFGDGVAWQIDSTAPIEYGADYWGKYRSYDGTPMSRTLNQLRQEMVDRHAPAGPVIDVGIGGGAFIETMRAAGRQCFGEDVNPFATEWLKIRGLHAPDVQPPDLAAFTLWDVFEHLPAPDLFLRRIRKGQCLFLALPVFDRLEDVAVSKHYRPNEHFWYWTARGLIRYLGERGFVCVEQNDAETKAGRESIGSFAFMRRFVPPNDSRAGDTAYYATLNSHGIGDTLAMIRHDLLADRAGVDLFWVLHVGPDGKQYGWCHAPMFHLLDRAGLFRRKVLLQGQNQSGAGEEGDGPCLKHIRLAYGARYQRILPYDPGHQEHRCCEPSAELRKRFAFLGEHDPRPYVTCQPSSSSHVNKPATVARLLERLSPALQSCGRLYIVGTAGDMPSCEKLATVVVERFPDVTIFNLAGKTNLEALFRVLYGSSFHVCAETCSAFFTAQLGIKTVQLFRRDMEVARAHYADWFKAVPLTCELDAAMDTPA